MQKTLLLSEIFPPVHGGSGRWFYDVYTRIDSSRIVVAAGQHPNAAGFDRQLDLNVQRLPLAMPEWGIRSWAAIKQYWTLSRLVGRLVRDQGVQTVHCGRCLPEGWIGLMLKVRYGVPFVCYVHGEDIEEAATSREYSWMVRRVMASAEYLVANSRNTAGLIRTNWGIDDRKIHVLNPGVDASRFVPASSGREVERQRRALGWTGRRVVLTVGRLQQRKGHDMLIRALSEIRVAVPDILYAIVGGGQQRQALEDLAREEGVADCVQFYNEISDEEMIALYQACDLFALPNRQVGRDIEGFGIVLLEAQACGRPVLAGDSGGTREPMEPGTTGLIVDCRTPEPLAQAIVRLMLDPARMEEMGQAGRSRVERHFDWSIVADRSRCLFESGQLPVLGNAEDQLRPQRSAAEQDAVAIAADKLAEVES